jgi:hypothetical protein
MAILVEVYGLYVIAALKPKPLPLAPFEAIIV